MTEFTTPDIGTLGALCRMQLEARRLGCRISVRDACPELRELIELAGLGDVLFGEAGRQPEPIEPARLEERVQRHDLAP